MPQRVENTPYRTVWRALRLAFLWEHQDVATPSAQREDRDVDSLTMLDRIAEGAMLRSAAFAVAGVRGCAVLRCAYGRLDPAHLMAEKLRAVKLCAQWCVSDGKGGRDLGVMEDAVLKWAGMLPQATPEQHAQRLGISVPTIHAWTRSREPARRSAQWLMDLWLGEACARVQDEYQERGVVP